MLILLRATIDFLHILWKIGLWLLFLLCSAILAIALLFPHLPDYRTEIEQWLSTHLQQPVTIGKITTYWVDGMPTLELRQVFLWDKQLQQKLIDIPYAEISLNVITSLHQIQWMTDHIVISGKQLTLRKNSHGNVTITGLPEINKTTASNLDSILWLLQQPHISLQLQQFTWETAQDKPVTFTDLQLTIQRHAEQQRKIEANVKFPSQLLQGGQFTLQGDSIWENTQLLKLDGQFSLDSLRLEKQFSIVKQKEQEWHINLQTVAASQELPTGHSSSAIQSAHIQARSTKKGIELKGYLNTLSINELSSWETALLGDTQNLPLVSGMLHKVHWYYTPDNWKIQGYFSEIVWKSAKLHISQASGQLEATTNKGIITLQQATIVVNDADLYSHPLSVEQVEGRITWQRQAQYWRIATQELHARNDHTQVSVIANLELPIQNRGVAQANITVTLHNTLISKVYLYIPDQLYPDVVRWLREALEQGEIETAEFSLQGPLNALFDSRYSHLKFTATVNKALLRYALDYPKITDLYAQVMIIGRHLSVIGHQGKIFNSHIQHVAVEIVDLAANVPTLTVVGNLDGQSQEGLRFIRQSPLNQTVELDGLQLNGAMELQLHLTIPLTNGKTQVQGIISFKKVTLQDKILNITLNELTGIVNFDSEDLQAHALQAQLFGTPITLSISALQDKTGKHTHVQLQGMVNRQLIARQLTQINPKWANLFIYEHLTGNTHLKVSLDIPYDKGKDAVTDFYLESDLSGMAINLPNPLGKTSEEVHPLTLYIRLSDKSVDILQFRYADGLNGIFAIDKNQLERGTLVFGTATAQLLKQPGLSIMGHIADFSLSAWKDKLSVETTHSPSKTEKAKNSLTFNKIDLQIDQLELAGHLLNNLILQIKCTPQQWHMTVKGDNAKGNIIFNYAKNKLNVDFKYLLLASPRVESTNPTKVTSVKTQSAIDPRQLPLIAFHADILQIGQVDLGNVNLYTRPNSKGLEIELLEAKNVGLNLQLKGTWQYEQRTHHTQVQTYLFSSDAGQLMQRFGYTSPPVTGGDTQLDVDVTWMSTPYDFDLATLTGQLTLLIHEGQITDIEPGAVGRVIGLFDVNTLPQRLKLDFSDVFQKGFGFERISGSFAFREGQAYTEDLVLRGPAARLEIKGRTGLVTRDYDQTVKLVPRVYNTLPIAGALAGGVQAGVIALALQKLLQKKLEKVIYVQYQVTGSWDKPEIELATPANN